MTTEQMDVFIDKLDMMFTRVLTASSNVLNVHKENQKLRQELTFLREKKLNQKEAAEFLGIPPYMVKKLTVSGELKGVVIGKTIRYSMRDLEKYMKQRQTI